MITATTNLCPVCKTLVPDGRRRGSERRFCSTEHKNAFWSALRRRAFADFEAGLITLVIESGDKRGVHAVAIEPDKDLAA